MGLVLFHGFEYQLSVIYNNKTWFSLTLGFHVTAEGGAFFAMWFGQLFTFEWLDRIPGSDVVALFGAELVVVLVSLAACMAPAVRASRANPVDVLRST